MIRPLVFASLVLTSTTVLAHPSSQQIIQPPLKSTDADPARHCAYAGKLYSRGSVVKQPDGNRVCEKVSRGAEPFMLGWDKAR